MSGKYLLDTNIVSAWYQRDEGVLGSVWNPAVDVILSAVVVGGMLAGVAVMSGRRREGVEAFYEQLLRTLPVLPCSTTTARNYATIRSALRIAGKPIPENDIWIAATAMEHDLTLVTRDAHFASVVGLRSVRW